MNNLLAIILKDTFTLAQLNSRVRVLKSTLLNEFFGGSQTQLTAGEMSWLSSLPPDAKSKFNKDNVYKIFEEIEKAIKLLPTLTIYLTFEPDEPTIFKIGSFARKLYQPNILLDTKIDMGLIAGCSLVWKGRKKDYSLKSRLDEKKGEVLENFKKFLR
ncbi:MAG: Uncharacterized protein G01um10147_874 [Microgenomates group bacterium Gr01-1014_7]|nr:MAG: Uncharacterized protein G01um10147_874 [Microgenomates group bacterium Gr01-1014_7]